MRERPATPRTRIATAELRATKEILGNNRRAAQSAGWTWGYCSAVTHDGWRWIVDVHRTDGRRYIVHSDELLSAFMELKATLL